MNSQSIKIVSGLKGHYDNYKTYNSVDEIEAIAKEKKNLYLSHYENEVHKVFIDIDVKLDDYKKLGTFEDVNKELLDEINNLNEELISSSVSIAEANKKDYKISYRVIINNMNLTIKDQKILIDKYIIPLFSEKFHKFFDLSVYRNGKLRLPYATKDGEDRPFKIIKGEFKDFLTCIIDNDKGMVKLENGDVESYNKELYNDINDDNLKKILDSLPNNYYDDTLLWLTIAQIFKKLNKYDIFDDWSKKSSKYNACKNKKIFDKLKPKKISVKTLWYYLQKENIKVYEELRGSHNYKYTNYDTARLFSKLKKNSYIYHKDLGWYSLTPNNVWKHEKKTPSFLLNDISSTITKYIEGIIRNYDLNDEKDRKKFKDYSDFLMTVQGSKFVQGCIQYLAQNYNNDNIDKLMDENRDIIAFNNKIYDFNTSEFRDIEPNNYISITTGYDINLNSDKNARSELMAFLDSIFQTAEDRDYLLKTLAYGLNGKNKLEEFYIWCGRGGNGKGSISTLMSRCLGNYMDTLDISVLTKMKKSSSEASPIARTKGKRYLMFNEPADNKDDKLQISTVKLITGNDPITARELYCNEFTFIPQFTLFILANAMPELSKIDDGIKRRIRKINFPFNFVSNPVLEHERRGDPNLKTKINTDDRWKNEFMLILFEYYAEHIKDCKNIPIPKSVIDETNDYLDENNKIKNWLNDNYIITNDKKDIIKNTDFFRQYQEYDSKMTNKEFYNLCMYNQIQIRMIHGVKYYYGIKIKPNQGGFIEDNERGLII